MKTVEFASSRELPRNEDMYVARRYSRLLSALIWKAGAFGFPFGILLPLALVGIVRHAKRIPAPVYGFLLLYPAAIIGVFVSGRYRIPVVPILAVPAAAGALYCVDLVRGERWPRAAAIAGAVCVVAAATSAAGPFAVEKFDYEAEMHTIVGFELMKQNRAREALAEFSQTLRLEPDLRRAQVHRDHHERSAATGKPNPICARPSRNPPIPTSSAIISGSPCSISGRGTRRSAIFGGKPAPAPPPRRKISS